MKKTRIHKCVSKNKTNWGLLLKTFGEEQHKKNKQKYKTECGLRSENTLLLIHIEIEINHFLQSDIDACV